MADEDPLIYFTAQYPQISPELRAILAFPPNLDPAIKRKLLALRIINYLADLEEDVRYPLNMNYLVALRVLEPRGFSLTEVEQVLSQDFLDLVHRKQREWGEAMHLTGYDVRAIVKDNLDVKLLVNKNLGTQQHLISLLKQFPAVSSPLRALVLKFPIQMRIIAFLACVEGDCVYPQNSDCAEGLRSIPLNEAFSLTEVEQVLSHAFLDLVRRKQYDWGRAMNLIEYDVRALVENIKTNRGLCV